MRPLYATRLTTFVPAEISAVQHHRQVVDLCHAWLVRVAIRNKVADLSENSNDSLAFERPDGRCSGDTRHTHIDHLSVWRGTIIHPYDRDGEPTDDLIRADLQVISDSIETTVVVRILAGAQTEALLPSRPIIHTPKIVRELIQTFDTRLGNLEARTTPRRVGVHEIGDLAHDLFRPDRLIPIVVISQTPSGHTLLNPIQLADLLSGLAQVAELIDFETGYALTNQVTKELSAFNGAVRIYWPKFHTSADRYLHRLYLPAALVDPYEADQVKHQIRLHLADIAATRIPLDSRVGAAEREFQRRAAEADDEKRRTQVRSLIQTIADLAQIPTEPAIAGDIPTLLAELSNSFEQERRARSEWTRMLEQEIDDLTKRHDAEKDTVESLLEEAEREREEQRDRAEKAEGKLQHFEKRLSSGRENPSESTDELTLVFEAKSLEAMVSLYADRAPQDSIIFLPECWKAARQSGFNGSLLPVAEMLTRLVRAATIFHDPECTGIRDAFREADEPSFSADISDTAKSLHRHEYARRYDDGSSVTDILLGPHVSFGSGNRGSSVGVYFYVDLTHRRFVVGHVGNHLSGKHDT